MNRPGITLIIIIVCMSASGIQMLQLLLLLIMTMMIQPRGSKYAGPLIIMLLMLKAKWKPSGPCTHSQFEHTNQHHSLRLPFKNKSPCTRALGENKQTYEITCTPGQFLLLAFCTWMRIQIYYLGKTTWHTTRHTARDIQRNTVAQLVNSSCSAEPMWYTCLVEAAQNLPQNL